MFPQVLLDTAVLADHRQAMDMLEELGCPQLADRFPPLRATNRA